MSTAFIIGIVSVSTLFCILLLWRTLAEFRKIDKHPEEYRMDPEQHANPEEHR